MGVPENRDVNSIKEMCSKAKTKEYAAKKIEVKTPEEEKENNNQQPAQQQVAPEDEELI